MKTAILIIVGIYCIMFSNVYKFAEENGVENKEVIREYIYNVTNKVIMVLTQAKTEGINIDNLEVWDIRIVYADDGKETWSVILVDREKKIIDNDIWIRYGNWLKAKIVGRKLDKVILDYGYQVIFPSE